MNCRFLPGDTLASQTLLGKKHYLGKAPQPARNQLWQGHVKGQTSWYLVKGQQRAPRVLRAIFG